MSNPDLIISCRASYKPEREYICRVLFKEILDIEYTLKFEQRDDWQIKGENKKTIHLPDIFFCTDKKNWLQKASLPSQPLEQSDLPGLIGEDIFCGPLLPVIFGDTASGAFKNSSPGNITIGIDILGSAFFMLTRYEEAVSRVRDKHKRFPAAASLAFQEGFLHRPVINEYFELLFYALKKLFPHIQRKKRSFRILPSHDVDVPFACVFSNPFTIAKSIAGDAIKRLDPARAIQHFFKAVQVKAGIHGNDPNNTFDQIMDISDEHNLVSVFYFLTHRIDPHFDADYAFDNPLIKNLIMHIKKRGHAIGLHGSYHSYNQPAQLKKEFATLKSTCSHLNIPLQKCGIRQHYLRWDPVLTPTGACQAGLNYDTSLSFADHAGFRCGFCCEYTMFDLEKREQMGLIQRPLVAMEGTVIDKQYMNLGAGRKAYDVLTRLKENCRKYNGDFTLLWHNSRFIDKKEKQLYIEMIK